MPCDCFSSSRRRPSMSMYACIYVYAQSRVSRERPLLNWTRKGPSMALRSPRQVASALIASDTEGPYCSCFYAKHSNNHCSQSSVFNNRVHCSGNARSRFYQQVQTKIFCQFMRRQITILRHHEPKLVRTEK